MLFYNALAVKKALNVERKRKLQLWLEEDLKKRFDGRILPIDIAVSIKWGALQGAAELKGKSMPVIDGLIAVSGLVHHCVVVTRNISDMQQSTAALFNPWIEN